MSSEKDEEIYNDDTGIEPITDKLSSNDVNAESVSASNQENKVSVDDVFGDDDDDEENIEYEGNDNIRNNDGENVEMGKIVMKRKRRVKIMRANQI
jgi:hypothetical protein